MKITSFAGKPAEPSMLVNVPKLITAYYTEVPDPSVAEQRVAFGTSGHRRDNSFDKSVSITAIEFIADAKSAIDELFRVTRPGGYVVVASSNSLNPWAARRKAKTLEGEKHILENAFFKSPYELLSYSHLKGIAKIAIHFHKNDNPEEALKIERLGQSKKLDTAAFVAVRWEKLRLI